LQFFFLYVFFLFAYFKINYIIASLKLKDKTMASVKSGDCLTIRIRLDFVSSKFCDIKDNFISWLLDFFTELHLLYAAPLCWLLLDMLSALYSLFNFFYDLMESCCVLDSGVFV